MKSRNQRLGLKIAAVIRLNAAAATTRYQTRGGAPLGVGTTLSVASMVMMADLPKGQPYLCEPDLFSDRQ
jgi:hypothetical protein